MPVSIAINGAAGRMGQRLICLCMDDADLTLAAALERPEHPSLGQDAGTVAGIGATGVAISDGLTSKTDVLIDFTAPAATRAAVEKCVAQSTAMVIGTTGLTEDDQRVLDAAGQKIPLLQAPNMSLGVNLLMALAGQVAKQLGDDYDIEIVESHHRFKKDAPSGTALGIAASICDATGKDLQTDLDHGRQGDNVPRQRGRIGMHALRLGDTIGEHTARFATLGERLELTHVATSRDVFAHGALRAAKWLAGKPTGRYRMSDMLGL